ncbi:MAG: asparaginase [Caldimonas sp.]
MKMPSAPHVVVVLGTGGTISARADSPAELITYRAGEVSVSEMVGALSPAPGLAVESEQLAQLDSKDMDFATWRRLAERVALHVARAEVAGVVVTHGTDTMEETAWFLQRVLAPTKPVVLTGAMRPASSSQADGPLNLAAAIALAAARGTGGVVVSFAGSVHSARGVRKTHPTRLDPFTTVEPSETEPPCEAAIGLDALPADVSTWPFVAICTSSAGADRRSIDALVAAGAEGIVVAATGNGTLNREFESAVRSATDRGVAVLLATRCQDGAIVEAASRAADALPTTGSLAPPQARVELILRLLALGFRPPRA